MGTKAYKALFMAIGIISLGYMIYGTGLIVIWDNVRRTGIWFVPVIGSWLLIYILNAFAFRAIIREPGLPESNLSFWAVLRLTISGYAINYITPFVALGGEPYRILELKPALGIQKATSSVLLYSLMHMFSHVLFWLASILLIVAVVPLSNVMLAGCGVLLITGLVLGYWFINVYKKGFTVSTFRLLEKVPFIKTRAREFALKNAENLYEVDEQIRVLYAERRNVFYASLFYEFVARVIGCLEIYFTAHAIGMEMSLSQSLIVSSGSSLFANLIFFFPMQLGTREGGLALALRSVGLPAAQGIFIGVVLRIREIVWIIIGLALMSKKVKVEEEVVLQ
ncbi:lysylphosphatidylglycerol synthase transmembrane domain-containing protein [Dyadobacter pollutisoli]|uniref:Lysylphosphatidylglycerol synthase transmembrane domain-containing protein n=1 Tax=Dyadobacter pollutisoli TaxID=2910158 RepID=A0A9E8N7Q7_9BACT|nr:lysylphosphatidylglycerol synthase transmembrane domain-containing protein [Dyadobacter pollutisoli]WAC09447.1 lysylphosphatidylglycerol synthase transmembrane domain-containing protein [Dyadobacter pollutisoli]